MEIIGKGSFLLLLLLLFYMIYLYDDDLDIFYVSYLILRVLALITTILALITTRLLDYYNFISLFIT